MVSPKRLVRFSMVSEIMRGERVAGEWRGAESPGPLVHFRSGHAASTAKKFSRDAREIGAYSRRAHDSSRLPHRRRWCRRRERVRRHREHDKKGTIMMVGNETIAAVSPSAAPQDLPEQDRRRRWKSCWRCATSWYAKNHIDLRLDTIVTQFNLERHLAVLGNGQAVEFRKACLATGSRARRPQVAGANLGNVFYLRSLRDVQALREVAELEHQIVIIGGGCIAAEGAALLSPISQSAGHR